MSSLGVVEHWKSATAMSTTQQEASTMPEQEEPTEKHIDERVDELEVALATVQAKVDQMVNTRVGNLEETIEKQAEEIGELREKYNQSQNRIGVLEEKLAGLAGLQENEETTAKKRRRDLVIALQRQAENNKGRASMTYKDVLDQWAVLGHGKRYPQQAYRAMGYLDDVSGLTHTKNQEGDEVIRINLEKFDSSTVLGGVNDVNNAGEGDTQQNAVSHSD